MQLTPKGHPTFLEQNTTKIIALCLQKGSIILRIKEGKSRQVKSRIIIYPKYERH